MAPTGWIVSFTVYNSVQNQSALSPGVFGGKTSHRSAPKVEMFTLEKTATLSARGLKYGSVRPRFKIARSCNCFALSVSASIIEMDEYDAMVRLF